MNEPSPQNESGTASEQLAPGTLIDGRYEIARLLGAGGMGAVYEARHKDIGRQVAVKVLHPALAQQGQYAQRFLQEARTANDVRHRNIVQILDFGVDRERPYMVLEFLRGESLAALLEREGPVTPGRIVALLEPVLRALAFAHARGVVHRDIKPENIFLALEDDEPGAQPVAKILDFGIAKRAADDAVRLTTTQMSLGTPAYMAPEQVVGARDVTAAADQYALGVLLFEALTGLLPHDGDSYNALIIAKATQPPTQLADVRAGIDPGFAAVVMRTLATDPAARFASVDALREALAPYAALEQGGAPPDPARGTLAFGATMASGQLPAVAVPRATSATKSTSSAAIEPVTVASPGGRARGAGLAASGVLALLVVVGGAAFALRARPPAPTPSRPAIVMATQAVAMSRPVPPEAADAVFRVRVTPEDAEVRLDGVLVGHGQVELRRPRDARRYQLELTAPGYQPVQDVLVAEGDVRIERALVRANTAPAAQGGGGVAATNERGAGDPAAAARAGHGARGGRSGGASNGRHPSILRSLD